MMTGEMPRPEAAGKRRSLVILSAAAVGLLAGCAAPAVHPDPAGIRPIAGPVRGTDREHGGAAGHAPELTDGSNISDYLIYALKHNESIRRAHAAWTAAAERPRQARALPDPRLSFETDDSFDERKLALTQTFPWYGKRALRGDAAESAALAAYSLYRAEMLKTLSELRKAYGNYYVLHKEIDILKEHLELLEYLEGIVRRRFETGAAAHADLVRTEMETAKLRDRLEELQDLRWPRQARLNRLLGRQPAQRLPWPVALPDESVDEALLRDVRGLGELAVEHNPHLLAIRHGIDQREDIAELAKKRYYPDITVGVMRREERMGGMRDDDMNMAMVSINIPLWRSSYDAGVREAYAETKAQRRRLADAEYAVKSGLENALFLYRDARRKLELYENYLLPKSEELLAASETAYRAGEVDVLNLLDAQKVQLNFELELELAHMEWFESLGTIEKLVGIPLTETLKRISDKPDPSDGKRNKP